MIMPLKWNKKNSSCAELMMMRRYYDDSVCYEKILRIRSVFCYE